MEIQNKIVKTDIHLPWINREVLAFYLDNVYTEEECKELIRLSEENGYETALINIGGGRQVKMTDVRNNDRSIIDSFGLSGELWERLKPFIPETFKGHKVVGLNERLRFLRYYEGQYFAPHFDGVYVRDDQSELSLITVQLYLNEGMKGGATTFLSGEESQRVECVPKIGRVLIFEHRLYHEGSTLRGGIKYTIRTDVMYENKKD